MAAQGMCLSYDAEIHCSGRNRTMQKNSWIIYAWPGLPQIVVCGNWSALMIAVLAAALLNTLILGSFGWSELLDSGLRNTLWVSLVIVWCIAAMISAVKLRRHASNKSFGESDLFSQAIDLYLKGDYYQAERLLHKLLKKDARDHDARMMLATLLRHTGRLEDASKQLDQLNYFEGAEKWELEIKSERLRLAETANNRQENNNELETASQSLQPAILNAA